MSLVSSGEIVIVFDSLLTYTERGFQKRGGGGDRSFKISCMLNKKQTNIEDPRFGRIVDKTFLFKKFKMTVLSICPAKVLPIWLITLKI